MSNSSPSDSSIIIAKIPDEVLCEIFYRIRSLPLLLLASRTCRHWRNIIFNEWFFNNYYSVKYRGRNLIGWWKFDDKNHIGRDSSGLLGNRYTLNGSPQIEQCILGCNCCVFDGHSVIKVPVDDKLEYQIDNFSISLWFLAEDDLNYGWKVFLAAWDEPNNYWMHIGFHDRSIESQAMISPTYRYQFNCKARNMIIQSKTWYHLVVRYSRNNKQDIWINGKLQTQVHMTTPNGVTTIWNKPIFSSSPPRLWWSSQKMCMPDALFIGAKNEKYTYSWSGGKLADITIWNKLLEPIEIRAAYREKVSIDKLNVGTYIFQ